MHPQRARLPSPQAGDSSIKPGAAMAHHPIQHANRAGATRRDSARSSAQRCGCPRSAVPVARCGILRAVAFPGPRVYNHTTSDLRRELTDFIDHYHGERNHRGKGNVLLFPTTK